jgi:hypothetical protein
VEAIASVLDGPPPLPDQERKAVINAQDAELYTPLMRAAEGGHQGAVERLLDSGADVTIRNFFDWTAAKVARTEAIKALLRVRCYRRVSLFWHLNDLVLYTSFMPKYGSPRYLQIAIRSGGDGSGCQLHEGGGGSLCR